MAFVRTMPGYQRNCRPHADIAAAAAVVPPPRVFALSENIAARRIEARGANDCAIGGAGRVDWREKREEEAPTLVQGDLPFRLCDGR